MTMPVCARPAIVVLGVTWALACTSGQGAGDGGQASEDGGAADPDLSVPTQATLGPTCDGNLFVAQQSELDALAGCVEITGYLGVETFAGVDLEPLTGLEVVGGSLFLGSNQLAGIDSLEPLSSLRSVGGYLDVNNTLVDDLSGLRNLTRVGGSDEEGAGTVHLSNNENLRDLSGLDSLTTFTTLDLNRNGAITSLRGLALPEELEAVLLVGEASLTSTDALSSVRRIGQLIVNYSESLQELTGLDDLEQLEYLEVDGNTAPSRIADLPRIGELRSIALYDNPSLTEVAFLPGLTRTDRLEITSNDSLSVLRFPELREVGTLLIANNPQLQPAEVDAIVQQVSADVAKAGHNQGEEALSPCPWDGDGVCDEVFDLCAEGTDADCICDFECGPSP